MVVIDFVIGRQGVPVVTRAENLKCVCSTSTPMACGNELINHAECRMPVTRIAISATICHSSFVKA